VRQVGHADKIWAVRFSHDGKYVATGSADRSFKVWDVTTRQLLLSYDRNEDHVTAFDLLPNQNSAIIGTRLGELYLLNLDSGERRSARDRGRARHRQNLGSTERASHRDPRSERERARRRGLHTARPRDHVEDQPRR
jgi:hypothetical protein